MSEILKYIIGDTNLYFLVAFYFYVAFGALFSMLIHYKYKGYKDTKKNVKKKAFDLKFWLKDNTVRLLTNLMCVFIVIVFKDKIPVLKDYELSTWLGLLTGCSLDGLIILIRNKTNINIFTSQKENS